MQWLLLYRNRESCLQQKTKKREVRLTACFPSKVPLNEALTAPKKHTHKSSAVTCQSNTSKSSATICQSSTHCTKKTESLRGGGSIYIYIYTCIYIHITNQHNTCRGASQHMPTPLADLLRQAAVHPLHTRSAKGRGNLHRCCIHASRGGDHRSKQVTRTCHPFAWQELISRLTMRLRAEVI